MTPDALFNRLAQIQHDTAARIDQIEKLAEQNRAAYLEQDELTARAFAVLEPDAERVILAHAWDGHGLVQHAIFEVDGVLVVRPTVEAWQLKEEAASDTSGIRLPGRNGHHGPAPLMDWDTMRDVDTETN